METLLETGPASRHLKISPEWTRHLADSGQLPPFAVTPSGRRLFKLSDLEKFRRLRAQRDEERESVGR